MQNVMLHSTPLCVDLDGTLLKTDTLYELAFRVIKQSPWLVFNFLVLLLKGKPHLKKYLSERCALNPELLPYNEEFLDFLRKQHQQGRKLYLVTGCNEKTAGEIAAYLGIFVAVMASDATINLTGKNKAQRLVHEFGAKGFDYAGNDNVDIPVWQQCREPLLVNCSPLNKNKLKQYFSFAHVFDEQVITFKPYIKAIRLHQWAKNVLLVIPALTSHYLLDVEIIFTLILAFFAFGCCASFSYIVNDLLDLDADRQHHSKKYRPFAAGTVSIVAGVALAALLLVLTLCFAVQLSLQFGVLLFLYFITTNLYSFKLKAIPILDVAVLAGLYTLRVIAGSVAISLDPSFWLIAFSAFLFFSLAIVKRLSELLHLSSNDKPVKARGYVSEDITTLQSLGGPSAIAAVLVLALYINSNDVQVLYNNPRHLWLLCPVILIWLGRVWLITGRGKMHDDPVVFALKDRISWLILAVGLGVLLSAKFL
jgi:4-hydroxybenzoate polyprenyltransferase/phosphoserine phosphatase